MTRLVLKRVHRMKIAIRSDTAVSIMMSKQERIILEQDITTRGLADLRARIVNTEILQTR